MENYRLTNYDSIIRTSDGVCIPCAKGNIDYMAYQQWIADGNTPIPAQPSPCHLLNEHDEWILDLNNWLDTVVRPDRDRRLKACDYLMMPDYPIDPSKRAVWEAYRAQLRDLPATLTAVTDSVAWPPSPA